MKTLYDQLKPEIKAKLEASYAEGYVTSIESIFKQLKTKNRYSELTIDDVRSLNTFSNSELYQTTQMDLMYGDHLFNN
jgi:hypothetical protein|tara:strand:+ start:272 stop:505 length:234 start_codon:yes stop_codon:yes gene_type:complete